jgi:hypothetical protein
VTEVTSRDKGLRYNHGIEIHFQFHGTQHPFRIWSNAVNAVRNLSIALRITLFILAAGAMLLAAPGDNATLRGTVADPSGAVVPGVTIEARNLATGAVLQAVTGDEGSYHLTLPAGRYELRFTRDGFQPLEKTGVELTAEQSGAVNVQLQLASRNEELSVTVELATVETATAQTGQTISAQQMTAVPTNGRSFTDLLAMQAGVVPQSSQQPNAVVMSGCAQTPPSGDLNPGDLSVSGQRETANGFAVNGATV